MKKMKPYLFCGIWSILLIISILLVYDNINTVRRDFVLNTPIDQLQRLGSHIIVGFTDFEEVKKLVSKGAVGGIYITQRNINGATIAQIKRKIDALQNIQAGLGLKPLLIAADQEGGLVSRLTPPLLKQPALADVIENASDQVTMARKVRNYAALKAKELLKMGVNLNLSPVVDLKCDRSYPGDRYSKINKRAISGDQAVVAMVAKTYIDVLEQYGIKSAVKHFPGLGCVVQDTHILMGEIYQPVPVLEKKAWVPFRKTAKTTDAFIMLGHVKLMAFDPVNPVSISKKVVQEVIRKKWEHDGVLMTDDLCMKPILNRQLGIGMASVDALNAGVDLILISYDGTRYYDAMTALINAENGGKIDGQMVAESDRRLKYLNTSMQLANHHENVMKRFLR